MSKKEYHFSYEAHNSIAELAKADQDLLNQAREITRIAYAPYSKFKVGAAARLLNGETVLGTNQENASYPVGICAERTLLSSTATNFPEVAIQTMAISYENEQRDGHYPISPCGMCRQALQEFEERTGHPIRLILAGLEGPVYIISEATHLLPLAFSGKELKK